MENSSSRYAWLVSIGQFFAWMISCVGAVVDALYIRQAALAILQAIQAILIDNYHRSGFVGLNFNIDYTMVALHDFLILILGCAAVAIVIIVEHYFRKGRSKGLLWKRILRVLSIELVVFLVMLLILFIL